MYYKSKFIQIISAAMVAMLIISAGLLAGCTKIQDRQAVGVNVPDDKKGQIDEAAQKKAIADFDVLVASNPKAEAVIKFIDENIAKLSKENASAMLVKLEEIQLKEMPDLEQKYYGTEAIQTELQKIYKPGFNLNNLDEVKNQELKDLLTETRASGFKVETAEGMFFPVMDYELYKKYSTYVTDDFKNYIELMAVESNVTPIKDAALMIGWDEIIKRALAQEQFIKNYPNSLKINDVKQLNKRYITFLMFGANNTPLFSYETNVMVPEAQAAYSKAVKDNPDSDLMKMISEYLNILGKTDYKFSSEAEKYRKDITEK